MKYISGNILRATQRFLLATDAPHFFAKPLLCNSEGRKLLENVQHVKKGWGHWALLFKGTPVREISLLRGEIKKFDHSEFDSLVGKLFDRTEKVIFTTSRVTGFDAGSVIKIMNDDISGGKHICETHESIFKPGEPCFESPMGLIIHESELWRPFNAGATTAPEDIGDRIVDDTVDVMRKRLRDSIRKLGDWFECKNQKHKKFISTFDCVDELENKIARLDALGHDHKGKDERMSETAHLKADYLRLAGFDDFPKHRVGMECLRTTKAKWEKFQPTNAADWHPIRVEFTSQDGGYYEVHMQKDENAVY